MLLLYTCWTTLFPNIFAKEAASCHFIARCRGAQPYKVRLAVGLGLVQRRHLCSARIGCRPHRIHQFGQPVLDAVNSAEVTVVLRGIGVRHGVPIVAGQQQVASVRTS